MMISKKLLLAATLALTLGLSACGNTEEGTADEATPETTEAPAQTSNLPTECTDYLNAYSACIKKVAGNHPEVSKTMEDTLKHVEESWATIPQDSLVEACKQARAAWESQKAAQGC